MQNDRTGEERRSQKALIKRPQITKIIQCSTSYFQCKPNATKTLISVHQQEIAVSYKSQQIILDTNPN